MASDFKYSLQNVETEMVCQQTVGRIAGPPTIITTEFEKQARNNVNPNA